MKDNTIKTSKEKFDPVEILSREGADRAYSASEFGKISGYMAQTCTRHCVGEVASGELIEKELIIGRHHVTVYALNTPENVKFFKE